MPARPNRQVTAMQASGGSRILIVSPMSFLARTFMDLTAGDFTFVTAGRRGRTRSGDDTRVEDDYDLDLERPDIIAGCAERIAAYHPGGLDGVLCLQGVNPLVGARDMKAEHFHRMLAVNLVGPTLLLQGLASTLNPNGGVVFVSSIAATQGSYDPSYAAAMAALGGLIPSLAAASSHLRSNSATLGLVENSPVHLGMTPYFVERHRSRMFQGRLIQAGNVARLLREFIVHDNLHLVDIPLILENRT